MGLQQYVPIDILLLGKSSMHEAITVKRHGGK
jgi:hypothetical protein